jgi:hypothetical protein
MNLRTNSVTKIFECFGIKLCTIVHGYCLRYTEATNNILPEEFLYRNRSYCSQRLRLNPLRKNILLSLQHTSNCLVLVGVDLTNPGLIFVMARLAVLTGLATKVGSGLLHIFDNFCTFEPDLLHPKLPSANKILV